MSGLLINAGTHAHSCGGLLPNDLGMFDMLGNVYEWCHERYPGSAALFLTAELTMSLPRRL